jgi:hypothetical protein
MCDYGPSELTVDFLSNEVPLRRWMARMVVMRLCGINGC